jgi:hypothetical protein
VLPPPLPEAVTRWIPELAAKVGSIAYRVAGPYRATPIATLDAPYVAYAGWFAGARW